MKTHSSLCKLQKIPCAVKANRIASFVEWFHGKYVWSIRKGIMSFFELTTKLLNWISSYNNKKKYWNNFYVAISYIPIWSVFLYFHIKLLLKLRYWLIYFKLKIIHSSQYQYSLHTNIPTIHSSRGPLRFLSKFFKLNTGVT